jgi:starvation-inducible DNA-binding protein
MPRTSFYGYINAKVTIQPNIGLDATARQSVVEILNLLLADEAVLSVKAHHAYEHLSGTATPNLQCLYDEQYKQIDEIVLEIAERVRILGGSPISGSQELTDSARLDVKRTADSDAMHFLADQEAFIRFLREDAQKCSEMYEDQGTFTLLVSVMRTHEKMAWLLRSNIDVE